MSEIKEVAQQLQEMNLRGSDSDDENATSEEDDRAAKLFQNPDIIEKIYKNLGSFEDRKSCLRINSHWYKECVGKFQQEGIVNFKSLEDVKEFTDLLSNINLRMGHTNFRFDNSMNLCASVEIVAGNDSGGGGEGDVAGGMDERTIIGNFLNNFATQTKVLEAAVIWRSTEELVACLNQFVNLEDFTLYFFKTSTPFELPLEGQVTFPKVKKLSIYHHFEDLETIGKSVYNIMGVEQLPPFILGAFPTMEYFSFRKWRKYEIEIHPRSSLGQLGVDNDSKFYMHFLLSVNFGLHRALKDRQDSGCGNIKGLILEFWALPFEIDLYPRCQLPYQLEHLEVFNPYWLPIGHSTWNQITLSSVASFFRVHGSTLRVFKMHIPLYQQFGPPYPDGSIMIPLEFLPLPQLEKLDLVFEDYMADLEDSFPIEKDWPIVFPPLSFSEMFPKLKKLNLMIEAQEENVFWVQNIHDHFMPTDDELEGIQVNLRIWVDLDNDENENHENWSTALMERMSSHPNVKKELLALRKTQATF